MKVYFIVEQKMSSSNLSPWLNYYDEAFCSLEEAVEALKLDRKRGPRYQYRVCKVTEEVIQL